MKRIYGTETYDDVPLIGTGPDKYLISAELMSGSWMLALQNGTSPLVPEGAPVMVDLSALADPLLVPTEQFATVGAMKADNAVAVGMSVATLGYWDRGDLGAAYYDIMTLANFGGTPNGWSDHVLANGLVAKLVRKNRHIIAEQFGVKYNTESSDRWQEAFYEAADLAALTSDSRVYFSCKTDFLTKSRLYMSSRSGGKVQWLIVDQTGAIKATAGGGLDSSTFFSSKPILQISVSKGVVYLGMIDCNRICSGVLALKASATIVHKPNVVRWQRFGYIVPDGIVGTSASGGNGNHALLYANLKQWEQSDPEFDNPLDTQWTGDALVCGHRDWFAIGCTMGWSRVALLLLDVSVGNGSGAGNIEGRNVYNGYKVNGCGDFFGRGLHLMQGRPPDDEGNSFPRLDNRAVGGPINIECWSQSNKFYLHNTDWDSGTGQFYGHRGVFDGVSMITGGQNRKDDRITLFDPMFRFYARADAVNPAGFELAQNNNVTVGFYPFEGNVWAGDYASINYDNRQRSPGNLGPVSYVGEWNPETAIVFPTTTTMNAFWLVRTNTHGSTFTFAGQLFTDGDLLFPIVSTPSTTVYAGNWVHSSNGQVDMLLRGVQVRMNAGERYVQATTSGTPILGFYSPGDAIEIEYDVGGAVAFTEWDGTTWRWDANSIDIKSWRFSSDGDFQPTINGAQIIGSIANRVETLITNSVNLKGTVAAGINLFAGAGSPEGFVVASKGCMYLRDDGGAGTALYIKESGAGNTGWVAK